MSKRMNSAEFVDSFVEANPAIDKELVALIRGMFVGYCLGLNQSDLSKEQSIALATAIEKMSKLARKKG